MDDQFLLKMVRDLPEFGQLYMDEGRVELVRSYKSDLAGLPAILRQWQPGDRIHVVRFPDGFKIQFTRLLEIGADL